MRSFILHSACFDPVESAILQEKEEERSKDIFEDELLQQHSVELLALEEVPQLRSKLAK